jgi:maltooligosyltrehalose trehalohydrolase
MMRFRVWAPDVKQAEVEVSERRNRMTRFADGWWSADVPDAASDSEYAFVLDDSQPLPDPRSAWQPHGVHGPSKLLDHDAFRWSDAGWRASPLSSAIVYELHVGTFTREGTFDGAIARLDHLADLGVTHVELMPVAAFPGVRGWGYDGVDLYAPHEPYGGPEGLKRLVDACHARGLAVILDVVYNHLGPSGNYLSLFAPYFTGHYATPWGPAVNLDDRGSDEVRRFLIDNALMWLRDYHMDGLRLDAVHAIFDASALHFLEQLVHEVDALEARLGRPLALIAESSLNDPRLVRTFEAGGYGLDAQWSDDLHHALHAVLAGETSGYYADFGTLADVAKALERAFVYDGRYSVFRERSHGRPVEGLSGHRFLGYMQTHDQVGNRARGERSSQLMSLGRLKVAAALVFTAPFVPMLFQGEEWGASTPFLYFTDHAEEALARAVREGRRREFSAFGWKAEEIPDPQAVESFASSLLDWNESARQPHAALLDWHRRLIRMRRERAELGDGRMEDVRVRFDEEARWLVLERNEISVAVNLAQGTQDVPVRRGELLLVSEPVIRPAVDHVELPPDAVAILATAPSVARRKNEKRRSDGA